MRLIFLIYQSFYFLNTNVIPLQNSSLGQLHTNGDIVPTFGSSTGSLQRIVFSMSVTIEKNTCFDLERIANEQDFFSRVITGDDESWIF